MEPFFNMPLETRHVEKISSESMVGTKLILVPVLEILHLFTLATAMVSHLPDKLVHTVDDFMQDHSLSTITTTPSTALEILTLTTMAKNVNMIQAIRNLGAKCARKRLLHLLCEANSRLLPQRINNTSAL
jgi:hypothetical protein